MMDLERDLAVKRWLGRLGSSRKENTRIFKGFYEGVLRSRFDGVSPSQIVDWQIEHMNDPRERFRIVELAQEWVNKQDLRLSTKQQMFSRIRSFFLHNRAELPRDGSFRFTSEIPPVEGQLTVEGLKRIILNCDPMYRAVFLFMFQTFLDINGMLYVNMNYSEKIVESLTKNVGVVKLYLPGRKRSRNKKLFYTMFSTNGDAATALREYLKVSPMRDFKLLFYNKNGKPLSKRDIEWYFHWHAVKVGIIEQFTPSCQHCGGKTVRVRREYKGIRDRVAYVCKQCGETSWACEMNLNLTGVRYGVNPHEMRDVARSRWQITGADGDVAEFMMQHDNIDPNKYNKFMKLEPNYPIQEYRRALAGLNILSQDITKVDRSSVDLELTTLREQVGKLHLLKREFELMKQKIAQLEQK